MSISFSGIPDNLRVPLFYMEFDNSQAVTGTPPMAHKILVLGQMLASGQAAPLAPVRITSAEQATALFGRGSMLDSMFRVLTKANTMLLETWALPMTDAAAGVAAAGSVTFGGLATAAGVLNLYVGGTRVRAAVPAGCTAAQAATALAEAVNAAVDPFLPVTAAVDGVTPSKVLLTCRWKGGTGNDLDLRFNYNLGETLPAGLTATVGAMTGGAADPEVAAAIAAFGDEWWNHIVMPYTDAVNLSALEAELADRWGPLRQMDGLAWAAYRGTLAATGAFGETRNSQLVSTMGIGATPTSPWDWAASYAARAAGSLSIDPARPLQTLDLPGCLPPAVADRWDMRERNLLLWDGIATYTVSAAGACCIEREITMYRLNAYGLPDPSYLDVQTPATEGYRRYAAKARITQKYGRHKLADDGTRYSPGQAIVTPSIIRDELLALYREQEGLVVENFEEYAATLVVQRNANNRNRVDVLEKPDVVNQLRMLAVLSQFKL